MFRAVLLGLFFLASCDGYNKILRSNDYEFKLSKAHEFYEQNLFMRSAQLYEELVPVFKGSDKAELLYYRYAWSEFKIGDYLLSQFHFKNYTRQFPNGAYVEECLFMNAYCYYLNSPHYKLDQTYTESALAEMQNFIDQYPNSTKLDTCNALMDKLHEKLERKEFETIQQYVQLSDWKAAIMASEHFYKAYPISARTEKLMLLQLEAHYQLAKNSVVSKMADRLQQVQEQYVKFVSQFPESSYISRAETISKDAKALKDKLTRNGF